MITSQDCGFADARIEIFSALLNNSTVSNEAAALICELLDSLTPETTVDQTAWTAFTQKYQDQD